MAWLVSAMYCRVTKQPYASIFFSILFLLILIEYMRSMRLIIIKLLKIIWYDKCVSFRIMDMESVFYSSVVLHNHDVFLPQDILFPSNIWFIVAWIGKRWSYLCSLSAAKNSSQVIAWVLDERSSRGINISNRFIRDTPNYKLILEASNCLCLFLIRIDFPLNFK